ncbi:MAG: CDP-alcohol phosphatidyltransferase family protein, partial [Roseovarius sp.]|nr:CDP-alcohol phosphatidyltransferase family protein [Roseovarius sp.]
MSMIQQNAEPAGASRAGATGVTPVGSRYAAASVTGALLVILVASGPLAAGAARVAAVTALYGLVAVIIGLLMRRTYPHDALGLCNLVTLLRLALATCLVAPLLAGGQADWAVFAVAAVALGLDGLDGWLARRQGLVSAFGARFDMEVDAALGLILALTPSRPGAPGRWCCCSGCRATRSSRRAWPCRGCAGRCRTGRGARWPALSRLPRSSRCKHR